MNLPSLPKMPKISKETLKKIRLSTLLYAFLAVLVVFLAASVVVVYALPRSHEWVKRVVSVVPYPAVLIGYEDAITFRALSENMVSIKRFYEAQDFSKVGLRVDFSTPEGELRFKLREKELLNKMIEDRAIMAIAHDRGIVISPESARQGLARKLEEYGTGKEVRENLERLYGWSLSDFEQKVVRPSLYEEKLVESFNEETKQNALAQEKIGKAQEALREKKDFSQVVGEFSEGQTAKEGGSLGWFALLDLAPELRKPVALQKVGVPGDVLESALGFHIILVEEVKKESGRDLYQLKQIFTRKELFADWLTEKMKGLGIRVLAPEYRLNRDDVRVEFKDERMKQFEKELLEKTSGDAMFFF